MPLSDHNPDDPADLLPDDGDGEQDFDFSDIELAYRQALEALDAAEQQIGSALVDFAEPAGSDDSHGAPGLSIGSQLAEDLQTHAATAEQQSQTLLVEGVRRVTPREVIEAALFVGGDVALTARKLASMIGQDVDSRVAVSIIDSLNLTWSRENRPYEIRMYEGGYRLELREEFADVSTRTFGTGPRDVKLTPETLEVLAFIAWNQPATTEALQKVEKTTAQTALRQLLRLQLVAIERTGAKRSDIAYRTTPKFLSVFGLKSLEELPTADIFQFK